ncbi:MAG: formate/nitrite transporter family protein [Patescibacteria group bacterium]
MSRELAAELCKQGCDRAGQPAARIMLRSALAGAYVALAAQFAVTTGLEARPAVGFGLSQLAAGLSFSLGLILVILGGAELFTGCNLTVGMAVLEARVKPLSAARQWSLCYLGNLLGALAVAALWVGSGLWQQADGAWAAKAVAAAGAKAGLAFWPALLRGIGCNILVCLAVLCAAGARDTGGKIAAVIFPVTAFVAMGFEHSVANMYYLPLGLWLKALAPGLAEAGLTVFSALRNLAAVTLGNIIGGAVLVGGSYFWLFGARPTGARSKPDMQIGA